MSNRTYKIAVIPGDGIGPEIMAEAVKVLEAVAAKVSCQFEFAQLLAGGAAWDQTGKHLPDETLAVCKESDAILFGAVGGPVEEATSSKWQNVERNVILGLRAEFDLFANLRPIKSQTVDLLIVRELTSDVYFGNIKGAHLINHAAFKSGEVIDIMYYHETEVKRIIEVGCRMARLRQKRLTVVDKANVLETSRLWRRVAAEVAPRYPEIQFEYAFVDNAAYQIAKRPEQFDTMVTGNLFGDILSDEAAIWAKSLGMIPSASIGATDFGMYEPAHGSAPKHAGKGTANPLAMILSAALMLRHSLKLEEGARLIESAVDQVLAEGYGTQDLKAEKEVGTGDVGNLVVKMM